MDYPEIHIGPEPTTDRFIAVVYGEENKTIKGNALTGVNELPFSGLSTFGSSFLNKFRLLLLQLLLLLLQLLLLLLQLLLLYFFFKVIVVVVDYDYF